MIVCDHCKHYATSDCRSCGYFSSLYGSITGDYYGTQVTPEEADRELREMFPEDYHCKAVVKLIYVWRIVWRDFVPFMLYERWNRPRQYDPNKYYPWRHLPF